MIKLYTKRLERRQPSALVRILYPAYNHKKEFDSILSSLEKAAKGNDGEKAKEAIWQAGLASNQLYMLGKRFPRSPIQWFKSEKLPEWLLTDLNSALADSHKLVNKLDKERTMNNALEACRINRKTILLLFLARLGYDNEGEIKRFVRDVERARDCTLLLAKRIGENEKKKEILYEVAKSEERRIKILKAMIADDMDKVCDLLREAIERAYEKKKAKSAE